MLPENWMLRHARLTRGNTLGGGVSRSLRFALTEKRRRSGRYDIKRGHNVLCPFTQQQYREAIGLGKNSWWRTASAGRPYRREEKAPASKSGRHIANTQAEACVTKPQDRRNPEKQRRRLWRSCCANQAIVGEPCWTPTPSIPKSHGFSAAIDAHNLSLYGAGEILRSVGAWEGQSKTMVRDDGTVAKIAGNCAPLLMPSNCVKAGSPGLITVWNKTWCHRKALKRRQAQELRCTNPERFGASPGNFWFLESPVRHHQCQRFL
jgi:hypothetical protein